MSAKILGAVLIIFAAYYFGCSMSAVYKNRVRRLEDLLVSLEIFKAEINYGLSLLPEVFHSIAGKVRGPVGGLFTRTGEYMKMKEGFSAGECWRNSLRDRQVEMELAKGQMELLEKMGLIWGRGDKNDQLKQATLMQELLRQALHEARGERDKNEKMWRYLGLLGGITVVILLL
ncbi:MAG: stage III sporulation protein AB [Bacillota bacterium]